MASFEAGASPSPVQRAAGGAPAPALPAALRFGRPERRRAACSVRLAALPVLFLAFAPSAVLSAQGDAAPAGPAPDAAPPEPSAGPATPAARERIPLGAAVRLLGRDVKGPTGEVVAQIANVLVDGSGRPLAAVLDYGGFMGVGRRRIAVAWRALRFAPDETPDGAVALALTRDQLKDFPEAKRGEALVVAAPADPAPR